MSLRTWVERCKLALSSSLALGSERPLMRSRLLWLAGRVNSLLPASPQTPERFFSKDMKILGASGHAPIRHRCSQVSDSNGILPRCKKGVGRRLQHA